jgi:hypothetical protein
MTVDTYRVSTSGQMSLPASARHRWNRDDGGEVDVLDLGFGVLTVPAGAAADLLGIRACCKAVGVDDATLER